MRLTPWTLRKVEEVGKRHVHGEDPQVKGQ
jgi:hypothetical protein